MARKQRSKGTGSLLRRRDRGPWIARWYDHEGRRREQTTRTTDRAAAERILSKRVADTALRRDGVVDPRADRYTAADRRPFADHVEEWITALVAKGVSPQQTRTLRARVDRLLGATKAQRISDLSASAIQTALGELHTGGASLQTCQHYLRAVKQFSRWLRRDGRARDDALAHLAGFNTATDRQYERRALDAAELQLLLQAAELGPGAFGLTGPQRAMLYRVAVGTGFRASELRSLTSGSFRLQDDPPSVVLAAATSKRRREDVQPIRADLADLLVAWLDTAPTDVPVWPGAWHKHGAAMIRADLRRARATWIRAARDPRERRTRLNSAFLAEIDGAGRVVDFHALRATYITLLIKSGASVKAVQELARHSDPKLTLNLYSKLGVHDCAGALLGLPSLTPSPQRERLRATGTDSSRPEASAHHHPYPRQLARETQRHAATSCDGGRDEAATADARNSLRTTAQCDVMRDRTERAGFEPAVQVYPVRRFSKPQRKHT